MKWIVTTLLALACSQTAFAKEIIKGEPAELKYKELVLAQQTAVEDYVSYEQMYFGDSEHPERGRLWMTTIYPKQSRAVFCYLFDYREVKMQDYLCEVY